MLLFLRAVGFYTELDFVNEAANQQRLSDLLAAEGVTGVYVPKVYSSLCTRRILVSEWIDGYVASFQYMRYTKISRE
jgi:predicted unusual protein kinase regulating ubiquinone biosynthesis (AarF/ABC1/UbiB family)